VDEVMGVVRGALSKGSAKEEADSRRE